MTQTRSLRSARLGLRFAMLSFPIAVALSGCDDSEPTLIASRSAQGGSGPGTSAGGSSVSLGGGGHASGHAGNQGLAGHANGGAAGGSGIGGGTGGVVASAGAPNGGSAGAATSGSSGAGGSAGTGGSGSGGGGGSAVAGAAGTSGNGGSTAGVAGSAGVGNGGSSGANGGASAGTAGSAGASAGAGGAAGGTAGGGAGGTDVTGGWVQMANGLPSGFISVLVADPSNLGTLYAASGDGGGIFKTTNSGALWTHASSGLSNRAIHSVAVDPTNPNVVFAGTEGGAFKTSDAGLSWTPLDFGAPDDHYVSVIAIDPNDSSSVYVFASDEGLIAGGPPPELRHTTDGGLTWSAIDIPTSTFAWGFVIDPKNSSHLFLSEYPGGLHVSTDSGATWAPVPEPSFGAVLAFAYEPTEDILCGTAGEVVVTSKAGGPWTASIGGAVGNIHIADGPTFYAAGQGGVFRSPDCINWTVAAPRQTYVVTTDASGAAYAGQFDFQDDDTGGGVLRSPDGMAPWVPVSTGLANGNVPALIVDPKDPDTLFVSAYERGIYKSTDGALSWKPASGTPNVLGAPAPPTTALVTDGIDLFTTVVLNKVGVYRTTDAGDDWTKSTILTADGTSYVSVFQLALDPLYETNGAIFGASAHGLQTSSDHGSTWTSKSALPWSNHVVADPIKEGRLWAVGLLTAPSGTPTATNLLVTEDGGDTWSVVALPVTGKVTQLAVAKVPADGSTVYATIDGAGLVKTTDAGADWTLMGKPAGDAYTALAIDPTNADVIYVASGPSPLPSYGSGQLLKSTDGGMSWKTLPITGRPLAITIDPSQPKTIYVGMQYEGVYKSTTGGE